MLRKLFNIIISIMFTLLYNKKRIRIDLFSKLHYKNLKNNHLKGSKKFPIVISNSIIGKIDAKEGCKLLNVIITNNVKLGKFVSINGPGTRVAANLEGVEIGSFSSIASNVVIQEYYHRYDRISSYYLFQNFFGETVDKDIYSKGKIIIEEDVWIGSNSVILSGITIGRGSVIAAGSIVTKDIPKYSVIAGNPAKVIKQRFDNKTIQLLEKLEWWNWDNEKFLKNKDLFSIENPEKLYHSLKKLN